MAEIEDEKLPALKRFIRTRDGVDFILSSIYLSVVAAKLRLEMVAAVDLCGLEEWLPVVQNVR